MNQRLATALGDDKEVSDEVNQLVAATFAVTARAGSTEPSVREILQQAGLSTKAFYRHFRSKDELLLVSLHDGTRRQVEYMRHRMDAHAEPLDRIGWWIEGLVRQAINPEAARRTLPWSLGFGRLAMRFPEEIERAQLALLRPLEQEIRRAVDNGTATSPDPLKDARVIFGYTMDNVRHHLIGGTVPDAATVRHLVDFARRALGAVPTERRDS